jgi:hypothetical protein
MLLASVLNNQLSVFTEEFLASFDGFPKLLENFTEEWRLDHPRLLG